MKIFVLGGTGFIGSRLVDQLIELNDSITVLADRIDTIKEGVEYFQCDRNDVETLKTYLVDKTFDVVYDLCCFSAENMKSILESLEGRVKHYILCSTISTYDFLRYDIMPIKENFVTKPRTLEEYGAEKAEGERILISSKISFNYTIMRPCYVYGQDCKAYRLEYLVDRIIDDIPLIVFNNLEITFQLLHVRDLVEAFIIVRMQKMAYGEIFNVCPDEMISLNKLIELIAKIESKKVPILNREKLMLSKDIQSSEFYLEKVYDFSVIYSNEKLKEQFNWKPKVKLADGIFEIYQYRADYLKSNPNTYKIENVLINTESEWRN